MYICTHTYICTYIYMHKHIYCSQCKYTISYKSIYQHPILDIWLGLIFMSKVCPSHMDQLCINTFKFCKTDNQTFTEMNKSKFWHSLNFLGTNCQWVHFSACHFSLGSWSVFLLCSSKNRVMNYSSLLSYYLGASNRGIEKFVK
jgi:hypothetical protein